jgi:hypothetical protein
MDNTTTDKPRIVEVKDREPDDLADNDWLREAGTTLVNAGEALLHGDKPLDLRVTEALVHLGSVQLLLSVVHPEQYQAASKVIATLADEVRGDLGVEGDNETTGAEVCCACSGTSKAHKTGAQCWRCGGGGKAKICGNCLHIRHTGEMNGTVPLGACDHPDGPAEDPTEIARFSVDVATGKTCDPPPERQVSVYQCACARWVPRTVVRIKVRDATNGKPEHFNLEVETGGEMAASFENLSDDASLVAPRCPRCGGKMITRDADGALWLCPDCARSDTSPDGKVEIRGWDAVSDGPRDCKACSGDGFSRVPQLGENPCEVCHGTGDASHKCEHTTAWDCIRAPKQYDEGTCEHIAHALKVHPESQDVLCNECGKISYLATREAEHAEIFGPRPRPSQEDLGYDGRNARTNDDTKGMESDD